MEAGGEVRSTRGETQVWEVICPKAVFLYFSCPLVAAKQSPVSPAPVCSRSQDTRMATPALTVLICMHSRTCTHRLDAKPSAQGTPTSLLLSFLGLGVLRKPTGSPHRSFSPVWIVPVPSPTLLFSRPFRMLEAGVGSTCHTWLCSGIAPVSVLRSGTCNLGVICHSGDETVSGSEQGRM